MNALAPYALENVVCGPLTVAGGHWRFVLVHLPVTGFTQILRKRGHAFELFAEAKDIAGTDDLRGIFASLYYAQ